MTIGVGAIVVVLALLWGGQKFMYSRGHESTDDAAIDGHIVPVVAKVGGYVAGVTVGENDKVTEGQILVQLDTAELAVKVEQANADLSAARAAAGGNGQAAAQVRTASGQRGALEAQVSLARANASRAHADLSRMQELAAKQIISLQQLDGARAAASVADAGVAAAERQASAATGTVTGAEAGTRLADARLQAASAMKDNAQLQLSYTRVVAPASGTVSRKTVEVGQLLQPAQQLMSIVADSGAWVTANFKETQLARMKIGQPVDISVDAYAGCVATGTIQSISGATGSKFSLLPPENATGNFTKVVQRVPVRIAITKDCGNGRPLRPGMSVAAHVKTG
ncbi:MAG TPA: HlyD family secretion protein [Gemmatimonadaceae bacterium]|nr:HlyD family secretion protein [Gemmatimonadaceae bacterium]